MAVGLPDDLVVMESSQGLQGPAPSYPGKAVAMRELKHLGEEFDIDHSSLSFLEVEARRVLLRKLPLHPHTKMMDLADTLLCKSLPIGEILGHLFGIGPKASLSGHKAGLDKGLPFPQLRAGLVIMTEGFHGADERTRPSRGTKSHVDLIHD